METHLDKKFYVPSIEEFYVGFEYEVDYGNNNWVKESIDFAPQVVTLPYMRLDNIRVKYLDQSDIEELGFTYKGKTIDVWFEKEGNFDMGTWTSYKCQLHYGLHDNRLFIDMIDMSDEIRVFNGIVKNKSELKKVLNMLNIK